MTGKEFLKLISTKKTSNVSKHFCIKHQTLYSSMHLAVRNVFFYPFKTWIMNVFSKFLEMSHCCKRTIGLYQGYDNVFLFSSTNNYATALYLQESCCKPPRKILSLQNHMSLPTAGTQRCWICSKEKDIMEST